MTKKQVARLRKSNITYSNRCRNNNTRMEQRVLVLSNNHQLIMFCSPFVFDSHEIKQFNAEAIIYLFVIIPVLSDKRLFQLFKVTQRFFPSKADIWYQLDE